MAPPTDRQLAFAMALGLKADLRLRRGEFSDAIDEALEVAKSQPPNAIQKRLAKAWGVKLGAKDTRDRAATKLFERWEDNPTLDVPDDLVIQPKKKGVPCGCLILVLATVLMVVICSGVANR